MANKQNRKGRSKYSGRFVMLTEHMLRSDAYRDLSVYARSLLVELTRLYNGSNNGLLRMSVRQAASRCGCSVRPAMRALRELESHGFIKTVTKGAYSRKVRHASEWSLCEHPVGNIQATREYQNWRVPGQQAEKLNHGVLSATDQCPQRQQIARSRPSEPLNCIPRGNGIAQNSAVTVSSEVTHIESTIGPVPVDTLNHISTLMPDGWCNQKAQARSGMGNKVIPLPSRNQSIQPGEQQSIRAEGGNQ